MAKWPNPCFFEGIGLAFYERTGEFRAPLTNEFYLSGAIVEGWRAKTDYAAENRYHIVRPTHHAKTVATYVKGEAIVFTPGGVPMPARKPSLIDI